MTYYTVQRVICMLLNIMYLEIYLKPSKKWCKNGEKWSGPNRIKLGQINGRSVTTTALPGPKRLASMR